MPSRIASKSDSLRSLQLAQSGDDAFITMGVFHALSFKVAWNLLISSSEPTDDDVQQLRHYVWGATSIAKSIGVSLTHKDMEPAHLDSIDDATDFLIKNVIPNKNGPSDRIRGEFGIEQAARFQAAQLIGLCISLADVFSKLRPERAGSKDRRKLLVERRAMAAGELHEAGIWLGDLQWSLHLLPQTSAAHHFKQLLVALRRISSTPSAFSKVEHAASNLVSALIPRYTEIHDRTHRMQVILKQLSHCRAGIKSWRTFEGIGLQSLRFLFTPPFRKIHTQARTEDGTERRDAVLTNTEYSGLWAALRQEFNCQHLICEFKNAAGLDKSDLNQLRIYLSKKTVGRFGLLFHRGSPRQSLKAAQRAAYEQAGILILLINEEQLASLMLARTFVGSADGELADMKADFELAY